VIQIDLMNKFGIFAALIVFLGTHAYLLIRLRQALSGFPPVQLVFTVIFLICVVSFPLAMILGNKLPFSLTAVLENIGAWWVILVMYFIFAVLFADILRLVNHWTPIWPEWVRSHYDLFKLYAFMALLGFMTILSVAGYLRFNRPVIRDLEIAVPRGSGPAGELTLVAASDVHLGNIIRKARIRKYVNLINDQKPDVVLFVGDLIDHSIRPVEVRKMHEELLDLKAPLGVYGIFGNHEYYGNVPHAVDFYQKAGITLLRDTSVNVAGRFMLIGRDDISQHRRRTLSELVAGMDQNLPKILLDHNPARVGDAGKNGVDLQLSGHTHDGQIWPINLIVRRMYPLAFGYQKSGNTHYYVSSGLGLWGAPLRIGTRSEIVKIRLILN
jgi:predicted MPP superfamily phosphohydrolase